LFLSASVVGAVTAPVPVADIQGGVASSQPTDAVDLDGVALFAADDGVTGVELWRSDGSDVGTWRVRDLQPGAAGSRPAFLTKVGRRVFFTAAGRPGVRELWKTDGTEAGTVRVRAAGTSVESLAAIGSEAFFKACAAATGCELWKSDGTESGTALVRDVRAGSASSNPGRLAAVGRTLFFVADDGHRGTELWKSDGTAAGTALVKDLSPGAAGTSYNDLTNVDGRLFFGAALANGGAARRAGLWRTDGRASGTVEIRAADGSAFDARHLAAAGRTLFFTARAERQLWKVGRDARAAALVDDSRHGTLGALLAAEGRLFFSAEESEAGRELWTSDGTAAGTERVSDIQPGPGSSNAVPLVVSGPSLFLSADDGALGVELWRVVLRRGPEADAGPDRTVALGSAVALDGSHSSDPDGDPLCYEWREGDRVIGRSATVSVTPAAGEHTYTLTVSDGRDTDSDTVTIKVKDRFQVTLTVTATDGGQGRIDAGTAGPPCAASGTGDTTCTYDVRVGESITLQPSAQEKTLFRGFTGACAGPAACTLTPTEEVEVGASFDGPKRLDVDITSVDEGWGVVHVTPSAPECRNLPGRPESCHYDFAPGTTVRLSAAAPPDSLSRFTGWTGACTGLQDCTITLDGHQWVMATFTGPQILNIDLFGTDHGWGVVEVTGAPMVPACMGVPDQPQHCEYRFTPGTEVTLFAAAPPDSMSIFAGWADHPGAPCQGAGPCTIRMDGPESVLANFTGPQVLTVDLFGTDHGWGVVEVTGGPIVPACMGVPDQPQHCEYRFTPGTEVTLFAAAPPDSMSIFAGWADHPGAPCQGAGPCTIRMDGPQSVLANFTGPQVLTVDLFGTDHGWGVVEVTGGPMVPACMGVPDQPQHCEYRFTPGAEVTLFAAAPPDSMSIFAGWADHPGAPCQGAGPCTIRMDGPRFVLANFTGPQVLSVMLSSADGVGAGRISLTAPVPPCFAGPGQTPVCEYPLTPGTIVTLVPEPNPGSTFAGWDGPPGGPCAGTQACTLTIAGPIQVGGTFRSAAP